MKQIANVNFINEYLKTIVLIVYNENGIKCKLIPRCKYVFAIPFPFLVFRCHVQSFLKKESPLAVVYENFIVSVVFKEKYFVVHGVSFFFFFFFDCVNKFQF